MSIQLAIDKSGKIVFSTPSQGTVLDEKLENLEAWLAKQEGFKKQVISTTEHINTQTTIEVSDMASFNRVILLGNLTRDPEIRYTQSGMAVGDLGLAVNDRRKGANGEWVDEATFVDVTVWSKTAEIAQEYLHKGNPVLIEGRLKMDTWEKDGTKHYKLKVVCERLQLMGKKSDGEQSHPPRQQQEQLTTREESQYAPEPQSQAGDGEIPF